METLTRLVSESLARHGFDRPVDYRRLQWSHWFRCESHHSLLIVPSKPGIFALAEEIMDLNGARVAAGEPVPRILSEAKESSPIQHVDAKPAHASLEERRFSAASASENGAASAGEAQKAESREPKADSPRRMLAVTKFFEDDDMAFVLDRMLSHENPMRARLASGRYFVRFVEIHDPAHRHSICSALNQWIVSSAEKATGIGSHFATSLELTPEPVNGNRTHLSDSAGSTRTKQAEGKAATAPPLNSAVATTIHCSSSFPSGF